MSAGKKEKTPRIPRPFRRPLSPRTLERKVMRRIHLESEREFLRGLLAEDEEGNYRLSGELDAAERRRLKRLAAAVKANRGLLVGWKVGIVAVLAAAVLLFNLFFRDQLAEQAAERALEGLFGARAEMNGTSFRPLAGRLSFSSLTVADRNEPMRNLFELGSSALIIDTGQLLRRKLIIEEMSCREIRFGTPRESSGALPASRADVAGSKDSAAAAAGEAGTGGDPQNGGGTGRELIELGSEIGAAGAEALIEQYQQQLSAPRLVDETQQRYREIAGEWETRVSDFSGTAEALYADAQALINDAPDSFSNPAEARTYLERLDSLRNDTQAARNRMREAYNRYEEQREFARTSSSRVMEALEEDIAFLQEVAGDITADAGNAISRAAEPILRERIGPAWDYAERALGALQRLRERSDETPNRYRDSGRRGSVVSFPVREYPRFALGLLELSLGQEQTGGAGESGESAAGGGFTAFTLRNVTDNQEKWGRPTSLTFLTRSGRQEISADLSFDLRRDAEEQLRAQGTVEGAPVAVTEGLEPLTVDELHAEARTTFDLHLEPDGSGRGTAAVMLNEMESSFTGASSALGDAVQALLSDLRSTELEAEFTFSDGELGDVAVDTDLDEKLAERLGDYAREQAAALQKEVEQALLRRLEGPLQTNSELREEISAYGVQLREEIQTAENAEALLDSQEERIRNRVDALRSEAEQRAREEAEKQSKKLQEEAEKQLEGITDDMKLPGF
jgi:uncharacterized protein (TIGR03545 family)